MTRNVHFVTAHFYKIVHFCKHYIFENIIRVSVIPTHQSKPKIKLFVVVILIVMKAGTTLTIHCLKRGLEPDISLLKGHSFLKSLSENIDGNVGN